MQETTQLSYAIASCFHDSFTDRPPDIRLGQWDIPLIAAQLPSGVTIRIWPLSRDQKASNLEVRALWVVLELENGRFDPATTSITFDSARSIYAGTPIDTCKWLLDHGLQVPTDGHPKPVIGRMTETIATTNGIAIGARFGDVCGGAFATTISCLANANSGERGIAIASGGDATAGNDGIAIAEFGGTATAKDRGIAIGNYELQHAQSGDYGIAVAARGGSAVVGKLGIAVVDADHVANTATAQGDTGAVLVFRSHDGHKVAVVGMSDIKPNTPYKMVNGEIVDATPNSRAI